MKKLLGIIAVGLIIAISASFVACIPFSGSDELSYVKVSINPEVEFVSLNGTVVAVNAANEDAEILLSDTDLVGQSIEDAVENFVDMAKEAGYIDEFAEDNEVILEIVCDKNQEKIQQRLQSKVSQYFNNNGIFGNITTSTLEEYAEEAFALGVSNGKAKMILKALDNNPDLDIQELKEMEMKELVTLFRNEASKGLDATVREAFVNEKNELRSDYAAIDVLKNEIEALRNQQQAQKDNAAIAAELAAKARNLADLRADYANDVDELVQQKLAERDSLRDRQMSEKQARIAAQNARRASIQPQNNNAANRAG